MNNYQISSDGTIFSIQEDGSIKRLAKIDEYGNVLNGIGLRKKNNAKWWIIIFLLFISTTVGFVLFITTLEDRDYFKRKYYSETSTLESEIRDKKKEIENLNSDISKIKEEIAAVSPFVIYKVEIGNSYFGGNLETAYGSTIYSSRTMYLKPKIYYKGFKSGNYTFDVKWYRPDGSMSTGNSSPYGYSQSSNKNLSEGDNYIELSGWGNESMGHWGSGEYRLEIWSNGRCVYLKYFRIYS